MADALSEEEVQRYARHIVLKGVGGPGQQKLKASKVLVAGAGGLGSPVIAYLAAAGVGKLGIADDDSVAISNLQRQVVHESDAIGRPKAESAVRFAHRLNPHVQAVAIRSRLTADTLPTILAAYDVVIDGTDNIASRKAIAEAARTAGLPLVSGAVSMFDGQVTVFAPGGPDFETLYPEMPDEADLPSCEATGILGAVTGVIGSLMAMEAIKLITGTGEPLIGRLLLYDGRAAQFSEVRYGPAPAP